MTPSNKKGFKCNSCSVLGKKSLSQPTTPAPRSFNDEKENITQRQKCKVNVSTENSFIALSDEEEVESSLAYSPNTDINRSFSTLQLNYKEEINELKLKIKKLEEKLAIADNEISNLASENYTLTKKLAENELKISQLTHICKSPKGNNIKKKKTTTCMKQLNSSNIEESKQQISQQDTTQSDVSIQNTPPKKLYEISTEGASISEKIQNPNFIYIIGDEQLRGLSAYLMKSGLKQRETPYRTYAHIIPEATSTEIANYCNCLVNDLTENDVVLLGFGRYDSDIHKLHSNICIMLNKLSRASVIMLPIAYNPHLNEKTLNYNIKLWTKHFAFCSHIDMYYLHLIDIEFKNYLRDKINSCIDYIEYKKHYLSYEYIRNHNKKSGLLSHQTKTDVTENGNLPKKGTIPYYFKKVNSKAKNHKQVMNSTQSDDAVFFRD